ncbi:protein NYNRIN-like [Ptychodera flava]|uniref:protein NYNRIN-like n=1 Tax=Ptychodera flava TaxID=63121 RepID=UPI003969CFA1
METKQLVLPQRLIDDALQALHNNNGHLGFDRTLDLVRARFYWPRMQSYVRSWCETCKQCVLRKSPPTATRVPLVSIRTTKPLELVCIDYLTLEPSKGGVDNILVVTDHFTRYAQAYPTKDQKATTVARFCGKSSFPLWFPY